MDNLINWFKLLFFLKTVLITSSPIALGDEWVVVTPQEPLEAITGGAAIYVDVSKYVDPLDFEKGEKRLPVGLVEGELETTSGKTIFLRSAGTSHANDSVRLIVTSGAPIPVGVEFVKVRLKSERPLEGVNVYWKNGSH